MGRHHAAGEKIFTHPVALIARHEVISELGVDKDVGKKCSARFEPPGDVGEEAGPVFHMLEHLD